MTHASRPRFGAFAAALLLAAAACVPSASQPAGAKPGEASQPAAPATQPVPAGVPADRVMVAHVPATAYAMLYSAIENGFMAEENIQVELQRVTSGADAMGFLVQGQVDVGAMGLSAGSFNGFNRGLDFKIVAGASQWGEKYDLILLGAADKVKSGELKTVADLKGKRVGVAGGEGSGSAYVVDMALRTVGLTVRDVQLVNISPTDIPLALKNGALDAGLVGVPFSTQAIAEGWGGSLFQDWGTDGLVAPYLYSGKFIRERPEVGVRFMVALMKGARAIQGPDFLSDRSVAIWEKYTGVKPEVIRASTPQVYSPDVVIPVESFLAQERGHREAGFTDYREPVPAERMIDSTFRERALARLGPYRP